MQQQSWRAVTVHFHADHAAVDIARMSVPPSISSAAAGNHPVPFVQNSVGVTQGVGGWSPAAQSGGSGVGGGSTSTLTTSYSFALQSLDAVGGGDFFSHESYHADLRKQLVQVAMDAVSQSKRLDQLSDQVGRLVATVRGLVEDKYFFDLKGEDGGGEPSAAGLIALAEERGLSGQDLISEADKASVLVDLLDYVADHTLVVPVLWEAASALLDHERPSLRGAAARVIAVQNPELAGELLPGHILREKSKLAKAIMRSALAMVP